MRKAVIGVATIALVGALAWWFIPLHEPSRWRTAVAESPTGADRYSWTDWAGVRAALHNPAPSALENAAYDADLLETTALRGGSSDLTAMGFTEADLDSELFVQGKDGDADILRLTKAVNPASWKGWTKVGPYWQAPAAIQTEVFGYVAIADNGSTLIGSNNGAYLARAVAALGQANPVPDTVSGDPLSAFTYSGSYACATLAMAHAGTDDQAAGQDLLARAGSVNPMNSFTLARNSATDVTVAMGFENHDQAKANADTRSKLAVGPAPGADGAFTDRFTLGRVSASGDVVTMDLTPVNGAALMGIYSSGPVLFATC